MAAPCALFASCTDAFDPDEFIKLILDTENLPAAQHVTESIKAYDWHIDTKYYTADVSLCTSLKRTIGNQQFATAVQAFIVYFDPKQESTFELMKAWMPYLEQIEPEILILVCNNSSHTDAVGRVAAQQWCIDNCFELVELNPVQDKEEEDLEDDFVETTGIRRIIQALHAHTWPNLELKQNPVIGSPYYRQLLKEESELKANEVKSNSKESCDNETVSNDDSEKSKSGSKSEGDSGHSALEEPVRGGEPAVGGAPVGDGVPGGGEESVGSGTDEASALTAEGGKATKKEKPCKDEIIDNLLPEDDLALLASLGNEDAGEESFEEMFEKLRVMKEKAEGMPLDQRKAYAEKIAVSFWKAIGGDDDEIKGLDDLEDELMPS
ncbi:alpha- and gamma-adaptin-binding protein p34-like [Haliotis rufescens]|uniref:alpha- and gamma-adaptin-binding protein p34-like n=1 Tax=Haliotis rufescens TaxID=6454 RepID=UPI00201F4564|nr:alpha- and gamma-adaptin-binding protein p34-like [Haliotis rufescens]